LLPFVDTVFIFVHLEGCVAYDLFDCSDIDAIEDAIFFADTLKDACLSRGRDIDVIALVQDSQGFHSPNMDFVSSAQGVGSRL
jgi:hypothetical protein